MRTQEDYDRAFLAIVTEPENLELDARADDEVRVLGSWRTYTTPAGVPRWALTLDVPCTEFATMVTARRCLERGQMAPELHDVFLEWGLKLGRLAARAYEHELGA